jgi:hypothetical protein
MAGFWSKIIVDFKRSSRQKPACSEMAARMNPARPSTACRIPASTIKAATPAAIHTDEAQFEAGLRMEAAARGIPASIPALKL